MKMRQILVSLIIVTCLSGFDKPQSNKNIFEYSGEILVYSIRTYFSHDSFENKIYFLIPDSAYSNTDVYRIESLLLDSNKLSNIQANKFNVIIYSGSKSQVEYYQYMRNHSMEVDSGAFLIDDYNLYLNIHNHIKRKALHFSVDIKPEIRKTLPHNYQDAYLIKVDMFNLNADLSFVKFKPDIHSTSLSKLAYNELLGITIENDSVVQDSTLILLNVDFCE